MICPRWANTVIGVARCFCAACESVAASTTCTWTSLAATTTSTNTSSNRLRAILGAKPTLAATLCASVTKISTT
ncbi:hypothetical protein GCM10010174_44310 [Kutzneria viridogrisea]